MRKDWINIEIGKLFETVTGNTPSKKESTNYGTNIPFIKPPDLDNKPINTASEFLSLSGSKKARVLPKDSVLITCIGNLGRTGINKTFVAFNQQINAIKPLNLIESKFTFYQAQNPIFRDNLEKLSSATTVSIVNKGKFNTILYKIAPLPEQKAIVAKIEQLFSALDNGITNLKKTQAQLKIYRQAVLKKAFEGELTKEWRESQNIKSAQKSIKSLSEIGEILTGNTPSKKVTDFYSSKEYPFYKPTDLNAGNNVFISIDGLSELGFKNGRNAPANSILVTCIGATIGKTGLIKKEGCFNQQINAIVPLNGNNPEYIYYQAISIDFQTQIKSNASATTLPILNKGKFSKLVMIMFSPFEQHQIVQEIETRLSVCDNVEANIKEALKKAELLRQSILKKAFEGELLTEPELEEVRNDPNWEPAEKLLERIQTEKASKQKRKRR